ncbi:hypothetical protein J4455_01525 [Candidatus Woesearchaeota archaeon]|nr:hypothetical protein [uncultured archaeon]AQS32239.1 hypothetical protein [uncultured archaeon]MBS3149358.1 hypothetical protein [Candidatus Woesearchaeota archaeon]
MSYQSLFHKVKSNYLTLGLVGIIAVSPLSVNCHRLDSSEEPEQKEKSNLTHITFDNFGKYDLPNNEDYAGITSGDFDGDGDVDIAILNNYSHKFRIIENKIPQKQKAEAGN